MGRQSYKYKASRVPAEKKNQVVMDLPPSSNISLEDDTPKLFKRLMALQKSSQSKPKINSNSTNNEPTIRIKEGESLYNFNQRVESLSRSSITKSIAKVSKTSQKRKERTRIRKEELKSKKLKNDLDFQKTQTFQFGDVVMEPPTFTNLPKRRGIVENETKKEKFPHLSKLLKGDDNQNNGKDLKKPQKSPHELMVLEKERARAIQLYRMQKDHKTFKLPSIVEE